MTSRKVFPIQLEDPYVGIIGAIATSHERSGLKGPVPESAFELRTHDIPMTVVSHTSDDFLAEVQTAHGSKKYKPYDPPVSNQSFSHRGVAVVGGSASNVCLTCEDSEIRNLLSNGHSRIFHLGWFRDIARCRACGLCRLLTHAFEEDGTDISHLKAARGAFVVVRSTATVVPLPKLRRDRPYELRGLLIDPLTHQLQAEAHIRPLAESVHLIGKSPEFHSRKVNMEAADLDLAQTWIAECCVIHDCEDMTQGDDMAHKDDKHVHGSDIVPGFAGEKLAETHIISDDRFATISAAVNNSGATLRVIDTADNCLTMIPWSGTYLSLSYVWPRFDTLRLLQSNSTELHRNGALTSLQHRLPKVIRDAMSVVHDVGERYLWVDALCITQDDPSEKSQLINAMDKVYGRSALTIVVATATSPTQDYGIPGIGDTPRTRRQHLEHLEEIGLVSALSDYHAALETSVWITRGWTFQENILSRRCLIFTDHQMFFRCGRDARCEDIQAEGCANQLKSHPAKPVPPRGYLNYALNGHFLEIASKGQTFAEYSSLVSGYSPRSFTMCGDVLNAFTGIMAVLLPYLPKPQGFFFGLPMHNFAQAILWYPTSRLERRKTANIEGTEIALPTWSWVGWVGSVGYDRSTIMLKQDRLDRVMVFWWRAYQGTLLPLGYHAWAFSNSAWDFSNGMLAARARTMSPMQLVCWGYCCRISVSREETSIGEWMADRNQALPCFALLDREGDPCGMLPAADRDWAERHRNNDKPRDAEFLLLSYASDSESDRSEERKGFFHPKFNIYPEDGRSHWCFYNVMLLEYDLTGVAYRRGIGRVHMKAFDAEYFESNHGGPKIIVLG